MARGPMTTTAYIKKSVAIISATPMTLACWYFTVYGSLDSMFLCVGATGTSDNDVWNIQMGHVTGTKHGICEAGQTGQSPVWQDALDGGADIAASVWTHFCGTFTNSTTRAIYRNGVLGTGTNGTGARVPASVGQSFLGRSPSTNNLCAGNLAFPAVWNVVLTQAEITALAAGAHPRKIRPSALISVTNLSDLTTGLSEVDLCNATPWTTTGAPANAANPPIYF